MPAEPKRKNLLAKSRNKKADKKVLYEFATLAYKLGFKSDEIHSLMNLIILSFPSERQTASFNVENSDTPLRRRGIPFNQHHEQDKPLFFLENLYGTRGGRIRRDDIVFRASIRNFYLL